MGEKRLRQHEALRHQGRLSRRRLLQGTASAGAGLVGAAVVGCGQEEKPAGAPQAEVKQPKRGGVLRRLGSTNTFQQTGLDPHRWQAAYTGLMGLFYQTLVRLNPFTFEVEPQLANRWESASPLEVLFTLAPGIKFHNKPPVNGRLLTADDVAASLNRSRTDDPRFINRSILETVDKIEAVDRSTLRVTLKVPDVTIFTSLAAFSLAALAPEVAEKYGDKFSTAESAVGTGAFVLQAMDDVSATLVRNPDYWKPGLPYLDGVNLVTIADDQAAWAAFLAGQIDVTHRVPGEQAKRVFADERKTFRTEWFPDAGVPTLQPNTRLKPFDDPRVTKALRLLVDHDEALMAWAEVYFGRGYLTAHFPALLAEWDLSEAEKRQFLEFKQPKDDAIREALALLSAAGFTNAHPLKFTLTGLGTRVLDRAQSELHQAQFNRLGQGAVRLEQLRLVDSPTANVLLPRGDFEVTWGYFVPAQPFEPDAWFRTIYRTNGSRNNGRYSDPVLDQMIDRARTITDSAHRKAAVKEIIRYLIDHAPYTSWAGRYQPNASQLKVQGYAPETISAVWGYHHEQVWLET